MMTAFEAGIGMSMPRWRILLALYQHGGMSQKRSLSACPWIPLLDPPDQSH